MSTNDKMQNWGKKVTWGSREILLEFWVYIFFETNGRAFLDDFITHCVIKSKKTSHFIDKAVSDGVYGALVFMQRVR